MPLLAWSRATTRRCNKLVCNSSGSRNSQAIESEARTSRSIKLLCRSMHKGNSLIVSLPINNRFPASTTNSFHVRANLQEICLQTLWISLTIVLQRTIRASHQVEFTKRRSWWSHNLQEIWNQIHRRLIHQETVMLCKKTTKQMTNHQARLVRIASAQICKRYLHQTLKVTHLLTHKDSRVLQVTNGHIQEIVVHKNQDQLFRNLFLDLLAIEKSKQLLIKKESNSKLLVKLKTLKLLKIKIQQPSRRLQRLLLLTLQQCIMLSQSFHSQLKEE